ncbi:MAG TPA: trigger factor, partial [Anaerolineae bacterium]|nr:trigger factor [Anaerolineae bacterium]
MKVTTEELSDRQVVMTVEVEEEQAQQALRQAARRLSHRMRIPGFRPGRAPYAIVLRTVGEDSLRSEAFEAIGQKLYEEALKEAEIDAYAQGALEDVQWDPLTFRVTVPLAPLVRLSDYGSLSVPSEPILVLDEDVAEALDDLRQRNAEWVPVDRAAESDDRVDVDIKGVVGEEEIMNQQNWERLLREDSSGGL